MGDVSSAWPTVELGRVLMQRKEFIEIDDLTTYARPRVRLHAQGIVLRDRVLGAEIKTKKQQVCRPGEFLVAEIDAKVGGFGIVPDELDGALVSSHYFLFQIDASKLDRQFLDFYSRTRDFIEQVEAQGSTNYAAIRPVDVLAYELPLPSLREQRRIVSRIESIAGRIDEARRLRGEADKEAASLAASTANGFFQPLISEGKATRPLGDLAEIVSGVTLGRRLAGRTVTLPYLRVANVQDGHLDLAHVKTVDVLPHEETKWRLERGDLLLTEGGDWDKLGRGCLWNGEIQNCIHQNHVFRVRVVDHSVLPEYLSAVVGSPAGKAYFQAASKQTTNLASINQRQLKAFPIPVLPIAEQRAIVAALHDVSACVAQLRHEQCDNGLERVVPSVLDRAFKGRI